MALEGYSGSVDVEVPVALSAPSALPVTVAWSTFDTGAAGIATADVDYLADDGTVTFAPGETSATVTITVLGDTIDEPPALYGEWGLVAFSNPTNATIDPGFYGLGLFVIIDNDGPPAITPGAVLADPEGNSGSRIWEMPVTLSAPSAVTVTVDWSTADIASSPSVAHPGSDYIAASGTVTFLPGETTATIDVKVLGDNTDEAPLLYGEWGLVTFSNPVNATIDTTTFYGLGLYMIIDDDPPPTACTIAGIPVVTYLPQSECDALVALYDSTNGPGWTDNTGWATADTDPCTWHGVTCTGTTVTFLTLGFNALTGPIPAEIGNLRGLQTLDLGGNQLSGSIPPETGNLTNLADLGLGGNELSGSIPPEIGNLTGLRFLWLFDNQLTGSIPAEIGNLTNLRYLELHRNALSGPIPTQIGNLTGLRFLYLFDNQLTGSIPTQIGNLVNLKYLELHLNGLSGPIPVQIGNLVNLRFLWLFDNQLTGSIPAEIGDLTNLRYLELHRNRLSGDITPAMTGLEDTVVELTLGDGLGGNDCFTVTEPALAVWLTGKNPGWDECDTAPTSRREPEGS